MSVLRTTMLGLVVATFAIGGCIVVDDHDDDGHHGNGFDDDGGHGPIVTGEPFYTTIDRDATLNTDLGDGAGFFVEYAEGGNWTVWTSCDANLTGNVCFWEASIVAQSSDIHTADGIELEGADTFDLVGPDALYVYAETGYESDRVTFQTDPGALVQIQLSLDGVAAGAYLVWYGGNAVVSGAPRTPVVFQPDAP